MINILCKIMSIVGILSIINGEIISMTRNMMCHYVQCQAQSLNVDWNNYYSYNNSNFKFINNIQLSTSFWAKIVNQNEQLLLHVNQNGQMLLNIKSLAGKINTTYYRLQIQYTNQINIPFSGMWVLYLFRLSYIPQTRLQILYCGPDSLTLFNGGSFVIGNGTYSLQNVSINLFQYSINLNQLENFVPFVDQVANLKFADQSQNPIISTFGDNLPDLLIFYLTFEEKILSQYLLDWTNNYYPMAGTSYLIDTNDPIINTTGVYICDQQVIIINNINLPNTLAISIALEIFNLTQITQIFSMTDSLQQQKLSAYVQSGVVYVNIYTPTQNITQTLQFCFQLNNNIIFFITLFQNRFGTKMLFDIGCFYQYSLNERYCVLINPLDFNQIWKLTIGSINNMAGCQFIPKLFSISQGNKQVNSYLNNNCQYQVGGQCLTCCQNFVRQSDGQCVPACNSTSYLQQVDPKVSQCRRTCHPTCGTCMEPNVCLTCDGIRINPPYCNCPPGYFDDKNNPYCTKYFRIPDVQSGQVEYQCISGNYSVANNFPIPYSIAPKVIISIDGIKQVGYGQFQIYVGSVAISSFTLTIFCAVDTLFSISWLSESTNFIKSVSQQSNVQATSFLNYTYQFPINQQSQYIAGLNGYLQPSFIISQGGDTQFINNSVIANMQSNASQIDFQLVEYTYLQNIEFNISTIGVVASNYGTQGVKHNVSLQHIPTQAKFIFLNKGLQMYQYILQFMSFQDRLNDVIQIELIFDGFNPQLNLTWNILFGMVSCQNPIQPCNIEDYIINNCATSGGYYLDPQNTCQQCSLNCSTCVTDSVTCLTCQNNQILQSNQCVCPSDKYLEISTFICRDCDITCLTCSGPLQNNCLSCDVQRVFVSDFLCICADGYYSDVKLCIQCLPNCVTCNDGISCLTCPQNSQLINNICLCDDGYYLDIKKRQCSQCSNRCLTCSTLNTCIACNTMGYRILKEGDCVCMDDYFENSSKQCKSCKDKSAMLIQSCNYKNCDDGVWTTAEGCDDGNTKDRDGCTKCEIDSGYKCVNNLLSPSFCYQCPTNCQSCQSVNKIVNCQLCYEGYFLSKNKCIKCGPNCKTCTQMNYCLTCYTIGKLPNDQGVCPTCEQTPGTYTVDGNCVTKCGDGVLTENEECDDNNKVDGDGCSSSCKLEEGFSCINGQCSTKPQPIVQASYVNTSSTNIIQIQSDAYIAKFCSLITAKVDGFGEADFTINVTKLDESTCNVKFNYQKTILENNLIHIFYPSASTNSRILGNDVRELVVTPRRQIYYSQSQIASGQTVSSAQDTFSLFLYFIGPAAILLGGFNFFWTLLDILTWLNNLYYINVFFPANISLIFQQSAWASISLIPTIIQFNQPSDEYYRESPSRYMDKEVDPFFFNNTYQIAGIWGAALLFYFVSKLIINISGYKKDQKRQSAVALQQTSQFKQRQQIQVIINKQTHPLIFQKILLFAQDYQQNVVAYLIKTLNLTFLDLVTAIILQLLFYDLSQAKNILVLVNFICAFLSIIVVLFTIYLAYNVSVQHKTLLRHKKQKLRYGSLYEGINIESANGMMYSFVNLLRKTLFITFQIYFYSRPLFQTASCCFISFLNVGFIVYANPFENTQVLLQNSIPDFCIFGLMLLCTILAIDDKIAVLDPIQRFNIGWLMLGLISLSILTQIIFLMKQFVENSFDNIKKASQYIKKLFM